MVRKIDLAYLAGLFDGEGSVKIAYKKTKNGYHSYNLVICFYNTYYKVLNKFQKFINRGNISKRKGTNKPIFTWTINTRQAKEVLIMLYPYLNIKRKQAKLGIIFQNNIEKWHWKSLTQNELKRRELIRNKISSLNGRNLGNNARNKNHIIGRK